MIHIIQITKTIFFQTQSLHNLATQRYVTYSRKHLPVHLMCVLSIRIWSRWRVWCSCHVFQNQNWGNILGIHVSHMRNIISNTVPMFTISSSMLGYFNMISVCCIMYLKRSFLCYVFIFHGYWSHTLISVKLNCNTDGRYYSYVSLICGAADSA